jgi:hypothetical protein
VIEADFLYYDTEKQKRLPGSACSGNKRSLFFEALDSDTPATVFVRATQAAKKTASDAHDWKSGR